ncbi:MAG: tRNA pseudouridine(38-40) synthase TruA [Bacteroidales bacterium]|nr:tRNA pseudouridine(38-40) synthase TruA [Bacteroidales bacterium]MCF8327424.1 tRNA pseudouridine(38-40) synthase TruA [Bacteroidales bacterium]
MVSRYFIELSFDGGPFHGWQRQKAHYTVQQCLEDHMSVFLKQNVAVMGAGRTDAGVHAKNFFAHTDIDMKDLDINDFVYKMNRFLPSSVVLHNLHPVKKDAHARFDAIERSYKYYITTVKDPFLNDYAHIFLAPLDLTKMNEAAKYLIGTHDFSSFARSGTDVNNFICDVRKARWFSDNKLLVFHISADRFLRNMVRAIVGTLIDVGRGQIEVEDVEKIMSYKNRQYAGKSVPGKGLFLCKINYPEHLFL